VVGSETRVKVVKNKVAPPFKQASSISCRRWISREGEVSRSRQSRRARKSGAWYIHTHRWGSKENARDFLKEPPSLRADQRKIAKRRHRKPVRPPRSRRRKKVEAPRHPKRG